jgi:2-C-methyl-D-erythritol 4-phosphate cytidylyltransferase/2-C-methyl-D-erythritol 2,4-cyclodiphosphate synthase
MQREHLLQSPRPESVGLIVAAGRGTRALPNTSSSDATAKQYRKLAGRTVMARSIDALLASDPDMMVLPVIHADDQVQWTEVRHELTDTRRAQIWPAVFGGATRQDSVFRGLEALMQRDDVSDPLVFIHDAARPFVMSELVTRLRNAVDGHDGAEGAIPAVAVTDTLKQAGKDQMIAGDVDRATVYAVQTPQVFRLSRIHAAHLAARRDAAEGLTDDAAIATRAGLAVKLVQGDSSNFKLTYDADFTRAEKVLQKVAPHTEGPMQDETAMHPQARLETRVGQGFDVHRFGPGDHVILGGIAIPHSASLTGHSDADVGLHAITDALLGAIAAGDIGSHFPPSDPQWKGADSAVFLEEAVRLVRQAKGDIRFIDLTFACEAPKIDPHREPMIARIAELVSISPARVSVKATTTERLGFTGRGEGIAAYAAATIAIPPPADDA